MISFSYWIDLLLYSPTLHFNSIAKLIIIVVIQPPSWARESRPDGARSIIITTTTTSNRFPNSRVNSKRSKKEVSRYSSPLSSFFPSVRFASSSSLVEKRSGKTIASPFVNDKCPTAVTQHFSLPLPNKMVWLPSKFRRQRSSSSEGRSHSSSGRIDKAIRREGLSSPTHVAINSTVVPVRPVRDHYDHLCTEVFRFQNRSWFNSSFPVGWTLFKLKSWLSVDLFLHFPLIYWWQWEKRVSS